ncbi:putative Cystatin domain-containing protein [Rosa chinensis]|uniref:Putative Cystatin domain-containing protein n=1 Tax=Rosa chinensis TaxID=74649 RepID=A0A2P6Q4F2_ROSCH|nr:cysteine proteinase inhibitor 1 [Rosa chinensis]PRQ29061.1 putative Cystatin domain-containing protein [Rosa chinensis]
MMMRHCRLLLLLFTPFVAADRLRRELDGDWGPIENINKPYLKEIAEFAVSEISKQSHKKLVFQSVLKGESAVARGMDYRLDIEVKDESSPYSPTTVIYKCSVFDGILDEGMRFKGCEILS